MAKKISIIDISSGQIRLALIDTKYINAYLYHKSLVYEGYQDGEFFDIKELFEKICSLIKDCEDTTFVNLDEIIIGVPGEFTFVSCESVEYDLGVNRKVTEKDLDVLFETGRDSLSYKDMVAINSSPIYYSLDNNDRIINPIGVSTKKISGLISYVLCEKYFLNIFDQIAQTNGVSFKYTSSILSQLMYLIPEEVRDRGVLFLDFGCISSTLSYVQGDGIIYSISFSLGGGNVAGDLTMVNEIPFEHSLELLKKLNLNVRPITEDEYVIFIGKDNYSYSMRNVNEVALARLEEIGSVINRAISLCPSNIPLSVPLVITGEGLGTIVGIKEVFSKILNRKISFTASPIPQLNKFADASLASLIALAEKGIQKTSFSLRSFINRLINKFRSQSK